VGPDPSGLPNGDAAHQARRIAARLLDRGVLVSESSRAALAARGMPGLFPEQV